MADAMNRLLAALNAHDLHAFVECFASDYRSEQPAHPSRAFEGREKVRENWTSVFAGVPDFQAELLTSATVEDAVQIGEWSWRGTHIDGASFAMKGVTVMGIEKGQIAWGRLYMAVIEQDGGDIDAMVRESYRPPDGCGGSRLRNDAERPIGTRLAFTYLRRALAGPGRRVWCNRCRHRAPSLRRVTQSSRGDFADRVVQRAGPAPDAFRGLQCTHEDSSCG